MSRGRLIALMVLALVALLFLGRWTSVMVAEGWWARTISPAAGRLVGQSELLRVLLDFAGVTVASAWFVGNLYVVYRAIGSVQVPRRVANLEINEALTPRILLIGTVAAGVLLGLFTGLGVSRWWQQVLLSWHGVNYGLTDPVLEHDIGLYVAQLPLWRRLHGFALLLVLLGLGTCFLIYFMIGGIRWSGRRPAVSDHARRHIGWLFAAVALVLAWGYWLEPYEMIAGLDGAMRTDVAKVRVTVSLALTGVALSTALLSAWWATRPRHGWAAGGWTVLAIASLLGHYLIPALAGTQEKEMVDAAGLRDLEGLSFGIPTLDERALNQVPGTGPPGPLALWNQEMIQELGGGDSTVSVAANQGLLRVRGRRFPVWISVRVSRLDSAWVLVYADDRTSLAGGPLSYRSGDTVAYPGSVRFLELPQSVVRDSAPESVVTLNGNGVPIGSWPHRLVLAWARQAGALFQRQPDSARLAWHLDPLERFSSLMPHVTWSRPTAQLVGGELFWFADGYATSATFPLVGRAQWREREDVATMEVPFLAVVNAASGQTRFFRQPNVGPLGKAWQDIIGAAAEPWNALPPAIRTQLDYPEELFQVQMRVLERPEWLGMRQAGRSATGGGRTLRPLTWNWADTSLRQVAAFETAGRGISAVIQGTSGEAGAQLLLTRTADGTPVRSPSVLTRAWERFATFEQLRDSLVQAKAHDSASAVGLWMEPYGLGAYQTIFGIGPDLRRQVVWVNLALGDSLGAGRNVSEAWHNLLGNSAPLLSGSRNGRLGDAQLWMAIADSALRAGDWVKFGKAFEALREILEKEGD
ncbi:MAG TPA: UPF0182 family protein [Gemmatimonadales bacterium]|nr:UPF0182 family protein [Gemmatimonadales bacterium]